MFNLSSAEGARFAEIVTEMSERLSKLGPSPLRPDQDTLDQGLQGMQENAEAAIRGEAE